MTCSDSASWNTSAVLCPECIESVDTPPLLTRMSSPPAVSHSSCMHAIPGLLSEMQTNLQTNDAGGASAWQGLVGNSSLQAAGLTHLLHGLLYSILAGVVIAEVAHNGARLAAQLLDLCSIHTTLYLLRVDTPAQAPELLKMCK